MMKKILISILAAAAVLCGCNKEVTPSSNGDGKRKWKTYPTEC